MVTVRLSSVAALKAKNVSYSLKAKAISVESLFCLAFVADICAFCAGRTRVGSFRGEKGALVSFVNISDVTARDGGLFRCTAHNAAGMATHASRLNVYGEFRTLFPYPRFLSILPFARHSLFGVFWPLRFSAAQPLILALCLQDHLSSVPWQTRAP